MVSTQYAYTKCVMYLVAQMASHLVQGCIVYIEICNKMQNINVAYILQTTTYIWHYQF